jgi:four helix bundle protein
MGKIRDFRDLIVWQRAMELSKACYEIVEAAPRRATRGIGMQLINAADSVGANIAEGHGRPTRQDYLRCLGIAHASLREVRSHLMTLEHARDVHGPLSGEPVFAG